MMGPRGARIDQPGDLNGRYRWEYLYATIFARVRRLWDCVEGTYVILEKLYCLTSFAPWIRQEVMVFVIAHHSRPRPTCHLVAASRITLPRSLTGLSLSINGYRHVCC